MCIRDRRYAQRIVTREIANSAGDGLEVFHPVTAAWFRAVFDAPTAPQRMGWPVIARGESALILAPTGTGKTLTAFLWCLDRLMLGQPPAISRQLSAFASEDPDVGHPARGSETREKGPGTVSYTHLR